MPTHVFVFGTLKEGFPNFAANSGVRVPGVFQTRERLPLYLVGERHSPWLLELPGVGYLVRGQVFEVDNVALKAMDVLERTDAPDGYRRMEIGVERADHGAMQTLAAYAYLKDVSSLTADLHRIGPLAEYTLEHAALYRRRNADQA